MKGTKEQGAVKCYRVSCDSYSPITAEFQIWTCFEVGVSEKPLFCFVALHMFDLYDYKGLAEDNKPRGAGRSGSYGSSQRIYQRFGDKTL